MASYPKVLSGKVALITGASSGLGAHFAQTLAGAGAEVLLCARRKDKLDAVAGSISMAGGICSTLLLDVTEHDSIAGIGDSLDRVDILINNAGLVRESSIFDASQDDWDLVIDTNLRGMFFLAQAAARAMKRRGIGGTIINVASILGLRQGGGVSSYAVSKAGVIQLTKVLALELARYGIRVNALAPGYFDTELNLDFWETEAGAALVKRIPQRRLGRPKDLDGPLLLLASDASAYMTGAVLAVDGGHLVSGL